METRQDNLLLWLATTLVLGVGLAALLVAIFVPPDRGYGMMSWGVGWGALLTVIPALLLVIFLVIILGGFMAPPGYVTPPPPALETLNTRYVWGEISGEEYLRVRSELEGGTQKGDERHE